MDTDREGLEIALRSYREDICLASARALGDLGDPEARWALQRVLDEDPRRIVRAAAARALVRLGYPASAREVRSELEAELANGWHPVVRATAAEALAELQDPDAKPALEKALADPDQMVREEVAKTLKSY